MADFIGNIAVPEIVPSGTFPVVADYPHGRAHRPEVVVHRFGSGNAKIEQRFLLGSGAKRFTVRKAFLNEADRVALRDFWESHFGPYGAFTYNAPTEDGQGTIAFTCRFENEPLSWEFLADAVSSVGLTLVEVPTSSPVYPLNATQTRFPSGGLPAALLSQVQVVIPLLRMQPKASGYPAVFVSDRRSTVGGQLYQARLLRFEGISQFLGNASDDAQFVFGNADRVMRDLANDVDLFRAAIEFSLFHVGTGIKLDLWKGEIIDWAFDAGPEFQVQAAEGVADLNMPYPEAISRECWKDFNDGVNCPFAAQGQLNPPYPPDNQTHFPSASGASCDKGYDTPNGCLAHGMQKFFGGILAEPQAVRVKDRVTKVRLTSTSLVSDSIFDAALKEVYTDGFMPVACEIAAGRDEGTFYRALGIVGAGPLGAYRYSQRAHTLDGQFNHGFPDRRIGLREALGTDPAGDADYFSMGQKGQQADTPLWRQRSLGELSYKDNFAAGVAFIELLRADEPGLQLKRLEEHRMEATVSRGLSGWAWTVPGSRTLQTLTNPIWIVVNMLLRKLGLRSASAAAAEQVFDVNAAIAAAAVCDAQVAPLVPRYADVLIPPEYDDEGFLISGSFFEKQEIAAETQFKFRGVLAERKPLRDWMQEVLMNCLGYYSFAFGKLKLGVRINSSVVEAFTEGNILFQSLQLSPLRPAFNRLTSNFADEEYEFVANSIALYEVDHAKLIGGVTSPLYLESSMNLAGTANRSQAARIITTRLREELGGISAAEWKAARNLRFRTTVLALGTEPGMVCSVTHPDMPGGAGEFRVTGWRLNPDYSIDIEGRTTTDSMYDMTAGPKPADVPASPVPFEPGAEPPAPEDWDLAADQDGSLRLGFTIPEAADYRTGELTVLEEIELLRTETALTAAMDLTQTTMQVNSSTGFSVGEYVNKGQETLRIIGPGVEGAEPSSTTWDVARGQKLSQPQTGSIDDPVYRLVEREFNFSFRSGFTLNHAGQRHTEKFAPGSVRILHAGLRFANPGGISQAVEKGFSDTWESELKGNLFGSLPGLRVTSGQMATMRVPGPLRLGDDLAEDLFLEAGVAIGIVKAVVNGAPAGAALLFRLDSIYSNGVIVESGVGGIPDGETESGPLASGAKESIDTGNRAFRLVIVQVGSTFPGEDLTIIFTY